MSFPRHCAVPPNLVRPRSSGIAIAMRPHDHVPYPSRNASINRKYRETVRELHENHSSFELVTACSAVTQFALWWLAGWSWFADLWPVTVVAWLLAAHVSHIELMLFHEAAHGLLG